MVLLAGNTVDARYAGGPVINGEYATEPRGSTLRAVQSLGGDGSTAGRTRQPGSIV